MNYLCNCIKVVFIAASLDLAISFQVLALQVRHEVRHTEPNLSMQQHYDLAQQYQKSSKFELADTQYKLFLVDALREVAVNQAHIGQYMQAVSPFEQAVTFAPKNVDLLLDYANAALAGGDDIRAKKLAQSVINILPINTNNIMLAKAYMILGKEMWDVGQRNEGILQFENAVAIDPSFQNGMVLAKSYLALENKNNAAHIFQEILNGFGNNAAIHYEFGKAYGAAGDPEEAIHEFKAAIAEDGRLPGVHYSLGAAYLLRSGDVAFSKAKIELNEELSINPRDSLSNYLLGYIAMQQHEMNIAKNYLSMSVNVNHDNADAYLLLGNIYVDTSKNQEAITAFRNAIKYTHDTSRNHYQIKGAYYQLGRLLMQNGDLAEGKKYIDISENMLLQNKNQDKQNLTGLGYSASSLSQSSTIKSFDPKVVSVVENYDNKIKTAIADGYNNLGAIEAMGGDYSSAYNYFLIAFSWNPNMDGLSDNLGRSAYMSHDYSGSIAPLSRALHNDPDNVSIRIMLCTSQYIIHDYLGALQSLSPIVSHINENQSLIYIYADSLIKTGSLNAGIALLNKYLQVHTSDARAHYLLGKALAVTGDYKNAITELQSSVNIDSTSEDAKYEMAVVLMQLDRSSEADQLLVQLVQDGYKNADIYYRLGCLRLANHNAISAIAYLISAEKLDDKNPAIHRALASAYRQNSMLNDALREDKQYQLLAANSPVKKN